MSKRTIFCGRLAVSLLTLAATGNVLMADDGPSRRPSDDGSSTLSVHPTNPIDTAPTAGGTASLSPITSHGGPVMVTPKAYLIWYGNWNQSNSSDTAAGQQIVRDFLSGLNGSPYFQINTTYKGPGGAVALGGEITDTGSFGTRLSDSSIRSIVLNAISGGKLGPVDSTGVYFVLTSSNVSERSGFCTQYCGWHTVTTVGGTSVKYSFVGNANRCLNACAAQTVGPNGNAGVDGMISVVAHELEEATTDPNLNNWYDANGAENADKCAWTFGQSLTLGSNGAYYNMTLTTPSGPKNYLVQRNLSAADNKCYINFVTKAQ